MHSRIIQVSTAPIPPGDYLSACHYDEHPFVGEIADYVSDDLDRKYELDSVKGILVGSELARFSSDDCFVILPEGKKKYFSPSFERFIDSAKEAARMSLEDFIVGRDGLVFNIQDSYCDKFSWYVYSEEFDTIPFAEFLRGTEPGKSYYIGTVLDYHW